MVRGRQQSDAAREHVSTVVTSRCRPDALKQHNCAGHNNQAIAQDCERRRASARDRMRLTHEETQHEESRKARQHVQ